MAIDTSGLNIALKGSFKTELLAYFDETISGEDAAAKKNDAATKLANRLADAMTSHLEDWIKSASWTIPTGEVITSVTGGSGSPAVGVSNIGPIDIDIE